MTRKAALTRMCTLALLGLPLVLTFTHIQYLRNIYLIYPIYLFYLIFLFYLIYRIRTG